MLWARQELRKKDLAVWIRQNCALPRAAKSMARLGIRDQGGLYKAMENAGVGSFGSFDSKLPKTERAKNFATFPAFHHLYVVNAKSTPGGQSEEGGVPWPA